MGAMPALGLSQGIEGYSPVTSQRLLNPEPGNWLLYRRTYDGMGYSPLDQIDTGNVRDLVPVWSFATGITEGHQSPPIVNDGVMFITTPGAQVIALDARTGEQIWRYRRQLPFDLQQSHPTNRGVALYEDRVYVATVDAFVVALDARTGEVVWETAVEDYRRGYYMTIAPLIVAGNVMVGVSGGERGIRGFVTALNAFNGEEVWKTYTIPAPGEFGNDTWPGDSWQTGGAPVWLTGTFDPETNLSFWGTGNPGPWIGDQREGDNLYTNSVLALDVTTGELKGYHQFHWNGSWDWDEVTAPMLLDVERDGETVKSLVHAGRNGYLWILEPTADGISFVDAWPYVYQDVFTSIDPQTGRPTYDPDKIPGTGSPATYCPSLSGGNNWPPAAYSPQTGYLYIPANENLCTTLEGDEEVTYRPGQLFMGVDIDLNVRDGADHIGELQAWNLNTGERAWTHEYELNNWGPVLATAGGLLFAGGTPDRYFRAFDAATGEVLWQQRTSSGVTGIPSTYVVDGVQYVAVQSGWGVDAQRMLGRIDADLGITTAVPQGGSLWVFALR
ncbi:MAG: PQQ-dependent dehydrogenase, methanol/ethanol family [Gammaproteobacteria bacterium]|nr:PQQ-dependent dehydrogenase, methanol/ethanol family [Gammaproteobacteria bacterium]